MRTLVNYSFALLFILSFFSCEKQDEISNSQSEESVAATENETAMEGISEDIDDIAFYGSESVQPNGKVAVNEESPLFCAEISHDIENKTITIDYGDGCTDKRGTERMGKIIIHYTTLLIFPGAEVTVTFEDFYINNIHVEGTRTIKNISESLEDFVTLEVAFEGGKFTWEDGTTATREAHWTIEWVRASNPINDEKRIDGSASGTTEGGIAYSAEITNTIVFRRECRLEHVFIPVQGVKVITWNGHVKTLNYGDGECDRIVLVTSDGVTTQVELQNRVGRRK